MPGSPNRSGEPSGRINWSKPSARLYGSLPDVDLLDTILLRGFVRFFQAVRTLGLETAYRTQVRTAFILTDDLAPAPSNNPDEALILRRTATAEFIPRLEVLPFPHTFTALNGDTRTLSRFDCRSDDAACSPYGFEFATVEYVPPGQEDPVLVDVPTPQVYSGGTTQDGTKAYHQLRSPDTLPLTAPRAGRSPRRR